ncbi:MAG TPA: NAD-binding protein [Candidatus Dormibacteraeota bacterium]|jgi:trk system potassium uptake protein TrkA|nr:NAD-binding protein [Candidatus Dormibacteraeota bacterium]
MTGEALPYVIIVGGGKVGYHLARHLIERDYEVTLIEKDKLRAEAIIHELGTCCVMVGDGDEMSFLATTGIERAGVVVGATGDDEDNLVACQLAKRRFNVPRTVARVNDPRNVQLFKNLGIDAPVSATELLTGLIESELRTDLVRGIAVKASGANLVDIALPELSRLVGRTVADIPLPDGELLVCIVRGGRAVVPEPSAVIERGDELIFYSPTLDVDRVRALVTS